ncbi:MAG: hypothetical protein Q6353_014050 [Candidatus Sigynarchaeum springense]
MSTTRPDLPPGTPGLQRARQAILDHERLARDNLYLARRVLEVANSDPRVDEPARFIKLARLLDANSAFHARQARYLAAQLAGVAAAFQPGT